MRAPSYRNPMRQPEDAPSFRFAVLEDGSDGRIVLEAYDGPETLAFITARPAKFARTKNRRTGVGVRASTLSDLTSPDPRQNVVWTVESVHAVPGWGPLMYEALLAFAALEGYSGWVTSDVMVTSFEAERVWERFAKRDDVEFRAFVGRNSRGEKMHAARALPTLAAKRAGLFVG